MFTGLVGCYLVLPSCYLASQEFNLVLLGFTYPWYFQGLLRSISFVITASPLLKNSIELTITFSLLSLNSRPVFTCTLIVL